MADPDNDDIYDEDSWDVGAAEIVAAVLSLLWLLVTGTYLVLGEGGGNTGIAAAVIVVLLPVATIWTAAAVARLARNLRDETARLQAEIDALRAAMLPASGGPVSVHGKLEEVARAGRRDDTALAAFTSIRLPEKGRSGSVAGAEPPAGEAQAALALGPAEAPAAPLPVTDFLRVLNFPENEHDAEGFRTLRRALHERQTAQLISSAQDVLSLLADDGIHMDDLVPERARPELWRRFAAGERGRAVAGLGGIRDRTSLALTAGRMRQDPAFREAAHVFLRRFDQMLLALEPRATDADLAALSDTRTARAFMLLGRVTGTFA